MIRWNFSCSQNTRNRSLAVRLTVNRWLLSAIFVCSSSGRRNLWTHYIPPPHARRDTENEGSRSLESRQLLTSWPRLFQTERKESGAKNTTKNTVKLVSFPKFYTQHLRRILQNRRAMVAPSTFNDTWLIRIWMEHVSVTAKGRKCPSEILFGSAFSRRVVCWSPLACPLFRDTTAESIINCRNRRVDRRPFRRLKCMNDFIIATLMKTVTNRLN